MNVNQLCKCSVVFGIFLCKQRLTNKLVLACYSFILTFHAKIYTNITLYTNMFPNGHSHFAIENIQDRVLKQLAQKLFLVFSKCITKSKCDHKRKAFYIWSYIPESSCRTQVLQIVNVLSYADKSLSCCPNTAIAIFFSLHFAFTY